MGIVKVWDFRNGGGSINYQAGDGPEDADGVPINVQPAGAHMLSLVCLVQQLHAEQPSAIALPCMPLVDLVMIGIRQTNTVLCFDCYDVTCNTTYSMSPAEGRVCPAWGTGSSDFCDCIHDTNTASFRKQTSEQHAHCCCAWPAR